MRNLLHPVLVDLKKKKKIFNGFDSFKRGNLNVHQYGLDK